MSIVSVEELRAYMSDISLNSDQQRGAQLIIEGVQDELETYLNRPVEVRTITSQVEVGFDGTLIGLTTPIVSITSAAYSNGGAITPLLRSYSPMLRGYTQAVVGPPSGLGSSLVTVTYEAGIEGREVKALREFVLRVAARDMENHHDDTLSVKDLSASDTSPEPEGPQEDDYKRVERFRRRTVI